MKPKSKRVSLSQKYKIQRKVKEHNRKARRVARKNGTLNKPATLKKDPGVPNLWPFKEQLLHQMEVKREKEKQNLERQKEQRQKLLNKRRGIELLDMQKNAQKREAEFYKKKGADEDDYSKGRGHENSRRAFYREFKKVVEAADVILEVLDARDPIGCRCPQVEQRIMAMSASKKIVLVLNKIDLVPKDVVEKWLKHLRGEFPTIAFKASTQSQRNNLGHSKVSIGLASDDLMASSECLGADNLIKLLKNYSRNADIKTSVTVGIIGYPNVGKSSIINSLKRSKACNVGPTPGVTRQAQEIHLDKNIKLLDCPGIVFPKEDSASSTDLVLRGSVKIEQVEDPATHVEIILKLCSKEKIMELYNVAWFDTPAEFLVMLAQKNGKLKKGGVADVDVVARQILQDWNIGKIPFYTVPPQPSKPSEIETEIVSQWSKEFDMKSLAEQEKANVFSSLKTKNSTLFTAMDVSSTVQPDLSMLDDDDEMEEDEEQHDEDDTMEDAMEEEDLDEVDDSNNSNPQTGTGLQNVANTVLFKGQAKKQKELKNQTSSHTVVDMKQKLHSAEDDLNPQTGKQLKAQMKKAKKTKKRQSKSSMHDDEDDDNNDDNDADGRDGDRAVDDAYDLDYHSGVRGPKGKPKSRHVGFLALQKKRSDGGNDADDSYDFQTDFVDVAMNDD